LTPEIVWNLDRQTLDDLIFAAIKMNNPDSNDYD